MNVWRIGSMWGEREILSIFKTDRIVFAGESVTDRIREEVATNDLVAITKGQAIVGIGVVSCTVLLSQIRQDVKDFADVYAIRLKEVFWQDEWPLIVLGNYDGQGKQFHRVASTEYQEQIVTNFNKLKTMKSNSEILNILKSSKNVVLTGAPGTGKTFLAKQIAIKLIFGKDSDKLLSDSEKATLKERIRFVQFHPAYDYTDFVEGLKPVIGGGTSTIGFDLKPGIFKKFCEDARKFERPDEEEQDFPFVFVIDEINRADLFRVFGELFYALDPSYRGVSGAISTQYSSLHKVEEEFYVPKNVYIIGTMNDIDRSVESIDFALRRRFAWFEVEADEALFDQIMADVNLPNGVKPFARLRYQTLNMAIADSDGLGKAYQIGPAYYRKLANYSMDEALWQKFWQYHLATLIREYVRGMPKEKDLMDNFEAAYNKPSAKVDPRLRPVIG